MRVGSFHFLVKRLVLPLAIPACLFMWMSVYVSEPWRGLFINLSAGFVVIILTVFYVDMVLVRHETARWQDVRRQVHVRVERIANATITSVRTALDVDLDAGDLSGFGDNDISKRRIMMIQIAEGLLIKVYQIPALDVEGWKVLTLNLQRTDVEANQLYASFGSRLGPLITDAMLNLQSEISKIITIYSVFPDIFGIPADKLPPMSRDSASRSLQNTLYTGAESNLQHLLIASAQLLRSLNSKNGD